MEFTEFWIPKDGRGVDALDYMAVRPDKELEQHFVHVVTAERFNDLIDRHTQMCQSYREIKELYEALRISTNYGAPNVVRNS